MSEHEHSCCHKSAESATTDLKDPVCGMKVTTDSAYQYEYQGQKYYFCNPKCQDKFHHDPEHYLNRHATMTVDPPVAEMGTEYTCPMHPDEVSDKSGKCPKCGMTLVEKK